MDGETIDKLVEDVVFAEDLKVKEDAINKIWEETNSQGIYPASIDGLYRARAGEKYTGVTVPAINIRTLTYDLARAIFKEAKKINAGAFIFEIARSEMGYTNQKPLEYSTLILAAALREGHAGPVFIQGDHFQVNAKKWKEGPEAEVASLKDLIKESINAGFYNIDIDSSTVVDIEKDDLLEQQKDNAALCAELTKYIRELQPEGISISVGGEIGEVGKENSNPDDLKAFMQLYTAALPEGMEGISKISVQTGTSHGGVVLPDGTIAEVKLDFQVLKDIGTVARGDYNMGGAVQHGASTLPEDAFHNFPSNDAVEVHLATQFQNMVYDSKNFPSELTEKVHAWLHENAAGEKKEGQTEDQFLYKTRKKALGPFKKDIWGIENRVAIAAEIEEKFAFLFSQLNIKDSKDLVAQYVPEMNRKKSFDLTHHGEAEQFEGDD